VLQSPPAWGPLIGVQRVPESKIVKNRVHLDLHVTVTTMQEDVARRAGRGATAVGRW
jgi:hypothetical protein